MRGFVDPNMDATLIGLLFVVHWKRIDSGVARPGKRDDNARKSAGSGVEAVQRSDLRRGCSCFCLPARWLRSSQRRLRSDERCGIRRVLGNCFWREGFEAALRAEGGEIGGAFFFPRFGPKTGFNGSPEPTGSVLDHLSRHT